MATATWSAAATESSNIAGTALNSLANGSASAIIADIDNTSSKALQIKFWVVLGSITPTAGGSITLRLRRKRSSTYADATATIFNGEQYTAALTTTASIKYVSALMRMPGPFIFGVDLVNNAGVTLASSGNELYYQTFNEDIT